MSTVQERIDKRNQLEVGDLTPGRPGYTGTRLLLHVGKPPRVATNMVVALCGARLLTSVGDVTPDGTCQRCIDIAALVHEDPEEGTAASVSAFLERNGLRYDEDEALDDIGDDNVHRFGIDPRW